MLLDHKTVDIAVYAEFINLTAPIIISEKRQYKDNCDVMKLRELMNVSKEAFALLLMENCFQHWKWIGVERVKMIDSSDITSNRICSLSPSLSLSSNTTTNATSSSPPDVENEARCDVTQDNTARNTNIPVSHASLLQGSSHGAYHSDSQLDDDDDDDEDNDDNCTQVGPGYRYQYSHVRKDNRLGAGPWTPEGMVRYNDIVQRVIEERKVRSKFEEHLKSYFNEQMSKDPSRKRKKKSSSLEDDREARKRVAVIDLFTCDSDD